MTSMEELHCSNHIICKAEFTEGRFDIKDKEHKILVAFREIYTTGFTLWIICLSIANWPL